ncbi:MAG: hypothetical protein IPP58_00705 [Holophagaceae bacterium]|uniref:Uncharacterized protein n=1 Tax=Candidatus Geothrix skivensis TaxID=2954439 RepID=A0A9D7XFE1_9BACT|nr:hypothetical protein [Candidatus Geothrix skivensis]
MNRSTQLLVYLTLLMTSAWSAVPTFRVIEKGKTPSYSKSGPRRQDLSAAVCVDGRAYLAYDGGPNSEHPEIRVATLDGITQEGTVLNRVVGQKDLEGMTFHAGQFYLLSGLSQADEDTEAYRLLTSFTLDPTGRFVRQERSVVIRDLLLEALKSIPDDRWYSRVAATFGVKGGLCAEGISWVPNQPETLVIGLRSPLYGPAFGDPTFGKAFALDRGKALLAFLGNPFSDKPQVRLQLIDLGGQGIRDIQYIPEFGAYLVLGGPVDKAPAFSLWLCKPTGETERIHLPEFKGLCRPEAIMQVPGKNEIYIFSEEGGAFCESPAYTYLRLGFSFSPNP